MKLIILIILIIGLNLSCNRPNSDKMNGSKKECHFVEMNFEIAKNYLDNKLVVDYFNSKDEIDLLYLEVISGKDEIKILRKRLTNGNLIEQFSDNKNVATIDSTIFKYDINKSLIHQLEKKSLMSFCNFQRFPNLSKFLFIRHKGEMIFKCELRFESLTFLSLSERSKIDKEVLLFNDFLFGIE